MVVSHHVDNGNQTKVLCMSNECSKPLGHLSRPLETSLNISLDLLPNKSTFNVKWGWGMSCCNRRTRVDGSKLWGHVESPAWFSWFTNVKDFPLKSFKINNFSCILWKLRILTDLYSFLCSFPNSWF